MEPIIIFGSGRSQGHTLSAIERVTREVEIPVIDLNKLNITHYNYDTKRHKDDFLDVAERMAISDPIILATPVYWYSMSAIMKTFIDRWSDLTEHRKDLGRQLAGKGLFLITSYAASEPPKGFEDPFSQTCQYLDMDYRGCFYFYSGEDKGRRSENEMLAQHFIAKIKACLSKS